MSNKEAGQKPPKSQPTPVVLSEALEAELAMLEAMLPAKSDPAAHPSPADPPTNPEGSQ